MRLGNFIAINFIIFVIKLFYIPSNTLPFASLILSWKYPKLTLTINCRLSMELQYSSINDLNALSMPYFKPYAISSPGNGLRTIQQAYFEAGCTVSSYTQFSTTTLTTRATTAATPTTVLPFYYAQTDAISTIPNGGNNINFNTLDSNFILSIYNTRILQYQNLLKLQQIFQDYNQINLKLYNLTFLNCY
jgi:hypothetical protein